MQLKTTQQVEVVTGLICDRCGATHHQNSVEFHEYLRIDMVGGYGSVFGDGTRVQLDLCPACTQSQLGAWMRLEEPRDPVILSKSSLFDFDPERHGGEFPTARDQEALTAVHLEASRRVVDGTPAEVVIAKLRAKVEAARIRRRQPKGQSNDPK